MTPDQIRQIAEEYAKTQVDREDCFSDEEYNLVMSRWIADVSKCYEFLTNRYCVVERSKVVALECEIHCAIMDAHNDDDMQMVAHEILDVMPRRFAAIFGSETFNKKEE